MPIVARDLHELNIGNVVENALQHANLTINEVDAIAVTNRPGKYVRALVFFAAQVCTNRNNILLVN